jgi:hypothetical protein
MTQVIRIVRGRQLPNGKFPYSAPGFAVEGVSRQPLLDACRQFKRMGADPARRIELWHEGGTEWDLCTTIGYGAAKTVNEDAKSGARFADFKEFGDRERFAA